MRHDKDVAGEGGRLSVIGCTLRADDPKRPVEDTLRFRVLIPLVAVAASLLAAAPVAAAGPSGERVGNSIISQPGGDGPLVVVPRPGVSKADYDPSADIAAFKAKHGATSVTPMGCNLVCTSPVGMYGSGSRTITPPGGSSGKLSTSFNSKLYVFYTVLPAGGVFTMNDQGQSGAMWTGTSPYNAKQIGLADTWSVTGVVLSISVPRAVGFSVSTNSVTYDPGNVSTNWRISHDWIGDPVGFNALNPCAFKETTRASFLFGTAWYSVSSSTDTAYL